MMDCSDGRRQLVTAGQRAPESPAKPRRIAIVTNGEAMNTAANARPDRIVVVDDDARIRDLLRRYLTQEGFEVLLAEDAKALNRLLTRETVHLIVLDLMLPGEDGLSICRRLRAANDVTPIIMLTAKVEDVDRIVGLEVGADDYLPKPFSMEELLARVRSLLRRHTGTKKTLLEHRGLKLDLLTCTVSLNDRPVEMTSREYALLEIFMQNPGRILPRNLICEKIWESQGDADANLLDVYMSRLRSKLESANDQPFFRTIRGVGYKMQ